MRYPQYYIGSHRDYHPKLFVDEFWMSDDQLIKLNSTGERFAECTSSSFLSSDSHFSRCSTVDSTSISSVGSSMNPIAIYMYGWTIICLRKHLSLLSSHCVLSQRNGT